jgi:aspartate/methionine/tyrosine aminotransferase
MWFKRMAIERESPEEYGYGAIAYNLGESSVPDRTVDTAAVDLEDLLACYGHHRGRPDLRSLIASQYTGVSADQFLVTGGAAEALFVVAATLLKPGDHIVVEHPNYPANYEVPRSLGCHVDVLPLQFDSQFELDLDRLADLVTPQTKLISLTCPHNPTGGMLSEDSLRAVVALAESNRSLLLFDETYRELAFDAKLPTAASLSPNAVSVSSLSKSYGFPGLRIGWIAADPSLLDSFLAAKEQINICNSVVDEALACAVLDRRESILSEGKAHVKANYEVLTDWLATQTVLECIIPTGGVVCFPRIRNGLQVDLASFYQSLRDRYKTFVGPGHWFEQDDRYFRIGYGWPTKEDLGIGLENLAKAVLESTLPSVR